MSDQPRELHVLLGSVPDLAAIQEGFDAYQIACFTERPPEFFALELAGEAGELANLEKKAWRGREIDAGRFDDEAADVFIALVNYCNARRVHLGDAVARKLRTIEQRRRDGLM